MKIKLLSDIILTLYNISRLNYCCNVLERPYKNSFMAKSILFGKRLKLIMRV